ncbi:MAG: hypothetical protein IPK69_06505 [Phycisphaerales bacterium]|nr:MAG: hypothetical protein IPK69_06505 [Phycisphaerales bacterium]
MDDKPIPFWILIPVVFFVALMLAFWLFPPVLPFVLVLAIAAIIYALRVTRQIQDDPGPKAIQRPTRCQNCNYDLKDAEDNRCPECGLPIHLND